MTDKISQGEIRMTQETMKFPYVMCLTHHRPKIQSREKKDFAVAQRTCEPLQFFPG